MKSRNVDKLLSAAVAALLAGGCASKDNKPSNNSTASNSTASPSTAAKHACKSTALGGDGTTCASADYKHDCATKNSCKGQGGCKTGDQKCAGKNSCKGKGGCAVPLKGS